MMEAVFFYLFAGLTLVAACCVVLNRHPIYSVLSLLVAMLCLAALFVMLGAYFVAALQILLYTGAVLVLFLFVIMLLNLESKAIAQTRSFTLRAAGVVTSLGMLILLVRVLTHPEGARRVSNVGLIAGTVETIGRLLFTTYLIPFELTSFLILAAIIGAVTLAKQEPKNR